jgi:predicted ATPase
MFISAIKFRNFKVFQDAELPLGDVTLLVGQNGAGKTTALDSIRLLAAAARIVPANAHIGQIGIPYGPGDEFRSMGTQAGAHMGVEVVWKNGGNASVFWGAVAGSPVRQSRWQPKGEFGKLGNARVYAFDQNEIAKPVQLVPSVTMEDNGHGLAAALTNLQDHHPERFEALNEDLGNWLPEFNRVLLDTPSPGHRAFMLRTREGSHRVAAANLSQGTLFSVALLSLAHLPDPPSLIGIEDPDRGMHPRLLRDILAAVERLANPKAFGDSREPVQVVITTHSPYMVDLFRDRPEDVVVIDKDNLYSSFRKLTDIDNFDEIVSGAHLGEAWFNGVFGGVPANT